MLGTPLASARGDKTKPKPPQLPRNFKGKGRWLVPNTNTSVPFKWRGKNGNFIMKAGGPNYKIHFVNLIYKKHFYTYTYKWPGIPDPVACTPVPGISLKWLNKQLRKESRFVGREVLQGSPDRYVNHWRIGVVLQIPGVIFLPINIGDNYVDQQNNKQWWQILGFGFQNAYDPDLDEWGKMDSWKFKPGKVKLPKVCPKPPS